MTVYKLCFYVPEEHAEAVKNAVFEAGAGRIGNYDCCSFQVAGQGQFRPLEGSDPYIGGQGEIETV
ncbi:MAG TPA: NGG1p interacting factor NIF3, partial [Alcanivorax sp.]|nr:NGG1p interacting factor NIF3 [Alcanivorax sp.]